MPSNLDPRVLEFIAQTPSGPAATMSRPICQPCTSEQIGEPTFAKWCERFQHPAGPNRKLWEWAFISEVIEQQATRLGRPLRLLGFGVGQEPITPWFAGQGHSIVATDLPEADAGVSHWQSSNEHAVALEQLDRFGLCPPEQLRQLVTFEPVDMRHVPSGLRGFDVVWSSCAFEHLGSLDAGLHFVWASLQALAPDGCAVHTTEFNVSSSTETVISGPAVLYRRSDLEALRGHAAAAGFASEATYDLGQHPQRGIVDHPPYSAPHLKVLWGDHVTTSYGLVFRNTNALSDSPAATNPYPNPPAEASDTVTREHRRGLREWFRSFR